MQEVEVLLPHQGYLIRDLLLHGVITLASAYDIQAKYSEDKIILYLRRPLKIDVGEILEILDVWISPLEKLAKTLKYKKGDQNILQFDFTHNTQVDCRISFLDQGESNLDLFPEVMEALRWFGGWGGSNKRKGSVTIREECNHFIRIGLLSSNVVYQPPSRKNPGKGVFLPVHDPSQVSTLMFYKAVVGPLSTRSRKLERLLKLNDLALIFSLLLWTDGLTFFRPIVINETRYRFEVFSKYDFAYEKGLIKFVNQLPSRIKEILLDLLEKNLDRKLAPQEEESKGKKDPESIVVDFFNTMAVEVYQAVNGIKTPQEAVYNIWRSAISIHPELMDVLGEDFLQTIFYSIRGAKHG